MGKAQRGRPGEPVDKRAGRPGTLGRAHLGGDSSGGKAGCRRGEAKTTRQASPSCWEQHGCQGEGRPRISPLPSKIEHMSAGDFQLGGSGPKAPAWEHWNGPRNVISLREHRERLPGALNAPPRSIAPGPGARPDRPLCTRGDRGCPHSADAETEARRDSEGAAGSRSRLRNGWEFRTNGGPRRRHAPARSLTQRAIPGSPGTREGVSCPPAPRAQHSPGPGC